jgi:hypothetical protein
MAGKPSSPVSLLQLISEWVERHPRLALGAIAATAMVLRIGAIHYAAPPERVYGTELANIARAIVSGRGIADAYGTGSGPTAHGSPIYPLLLSGVYSMFGFGYWGAIAQMAFGLLQVAGIFFLLPAFSEACELPLPSGMLGGLYFAIPLSSFSERGDWEAPLSALTILAAVILAIRLWRRDTWRIGAAWLAGIFCGTAILISPPLTLWFAALTVAGIVSKRPGIARFLLIAGAAAALTVTPWTIRNYMVLGAPIWSRSNFGLEFHLSHNDQARAEFEDFYSSGGAGLHPSESDQERRRLIETGEVAYNREKLREGLRWASTHPRREMILLTERIFHFWFPTLHRRSQTAVAWILMLLGLGGLVTWVRAGGAGACVISTLFLTFPLVYYLDQANNRYMYPLSPIVMVFAGNLTRRVLAKLTAGVQVRARQARAANA